MVWGAVLSSAITRERDDPLAGARRSVRVAELVVVRFVFFVVERRAVCGRGCSAGQLFAQRIEVGTAAGVLQLAGDFGLLGFGPAAPHGSTPSSETGDGRALSPRPPAKRTCSGGGPAAPTMRWWLPVQALQAVRRAVG